MNTTKKRIFYSLYTITAIILFLYLLFPSHEIKNFIKYKASSIKPGYIMEIEDVTLAFPPGINLHMLSILNDNELLIDMEQARIVPSLMSLAGSNPEFNIKARAYEGIVNTKVNLKKNEQKNASDLPAGIPIQTDSILERIQIGQIKALQNISIFNSAGYNLTGVLGGKITYNGTGSSGVADANLSISNCIVEFKTPFFNLKDLAFTQIDAKITLHNFQNLQIKETIIKGNQAGGNISGTITLKKPSGKSILNLSGTIKPQPALIAKLGGMASLFLKQKQGSTGFPFRITGTLEKPGFSLK